MIRIKNPNPSRLPNEYQEVEYIESSGTQYINTGFIPNQDTRVVMSGMLLAHSANASLFGTRYSSASRQYTVTWEDTNNRFLSRFGNNDVPMPFTEGTEFQVDKNKNITTLNGVEYTNTDNDFTCSTALYLFATNNNGSLMHYGKLKLYSCKIYDNDILVRDFVPCYRKSDNVAGLYDLVNNEFYTNAGTGTFLIGAEVGRRDINIKPTIGGKTLLEKYIENMLVYKRGPSYIYTEFSSCPFPTDWDSIEGSNNNWGNTNNWGYWSIHSSSYSTSSPTLRVTCAFDNSYSTSTYWMPAKLTSATETATVEIDCPVPIKPNSISIMYRYAGGNSVIQGYNDDTGSWEDLSKLTSSTSRRTDTFSIATENFYSKFRIVFYRYSSTYGNPMLHEFQITSGTIRQEG